MILETILITTTLVFTIGIWFDANPHIKRIELSISHDNDDNDNDNNDNDNNYENYDGDDTSVCV